MKFMTSFVRKPAHPKKVKNVGIALRKVMKDIGDEIKTELQGIVAPFESNINIIATSKTDSRDFTLEIMGDPNDTATINAAGVSVSSHDLLKFLDGGTSVSYVAMPSDFDNETSPNSKDTAHKDYDRDGIYFSSEPGPGIAPRRWLKLLLAEYEDKITERLHAETKRYLS